jgi:hypothetical protein
VPTPPIDRLAEPARSVGSSPDPAQPRDASTPIDERSRGWDHLARYLDDLADAGGGSAVAPRRRRRAVPSAVAWINGRRALIAREDRSGRIVTSRVERGDLPELAYLNLVVRAIGDRERVIILGPGCARLALERAYVDMHRRPDHLVDVEPAGLLDEPGVVDRLLRLAS